MRKGFLTIGRAVSSLIILGLSVTQTLSSEAPEPLEENLTSALVDSSAEFSALRFEDGSESLNDRCPVRKARLNTKLRPMFVNGQPIGFC